MMLLTIIPNWNSIDSVRSVHSVFELAGLVFFALLVVAEAFSHNSKDEGRKHLLDAIGIWFFAIAVICEIIAYPYGRRNDELSAQVIGSLDTKATDAAGKATQALNDSKDAETKSGDAADKAGKALGKVDSANRREAILEKQTNALDERIRQAKAFADIALARTHPRAYRMDAKKFIDKLKGVAPFNVEIRYKPEDAEAYGLAEKIAQALGKGFDGTGKDGLGWNVVGPLPLRDRPRFFPSGTRDVPPSTFFAAGFAYGGGFEVGGVPTEPNSGAPVWKLSDAMDAAGIHFMWINQEVNLPANTVRVIVLAQFD